MDQEESWTDPWRHSCLFRLWLALERRNWHSGGSRVFLLKSRSRLTFWAVVFLSACNYLGYPHKLDTPYLFASPPLSLILSPVQSDFWRARCSAHTLAKTIILGWKIRKLLYFNVFQKNDLPPGSPTPLGSYDVKSWKKEVIRQVHKWVINVCFHSLVMKRC